MSRESRLINKMNPGPLGNNNFILPNTSGDHVRSIKRADPVDDLDLVNKKYCDNLVSPVKLNEVENPDGDKSFTMSNKLLAFRYTAPTPAGDFSGAFEIEAAGGFSGNLLHVHQHTGNPGAVHMVHLEAEDTDVLPLCSIHINGRQLQLANVSESIFCNFTVDASHDLTLDPSSTGKVIINSALETTGTATIGGIGYFNAIGVGLDVLHSAFIGNHLEVGDNITVGGTVDGIDVGTDVAANTTHRGLTNNPHSTEGTNLKSTGENGATKFLREDGDGTCSWQAAAGGGGDVTAAINLTANTIVQGDDGAKGVKTSTATVGQIAANVAHTGGDGSDHADVATNTAASHAESHNMASHSDDDTYNILTTGTLGCGAITTTGQFICSSTSPASFASIVALNRNTISRLSINDTGVDGKSIHLQTGTSGDVDIFRIQNATDAVTLAEWVPSTGAVKFPGSISLPNNAFITNTGDVIELLIGIDNAGNPDQDNILIGGIDIGGGDEYYNVGTVFIFGKTIQLGDAGTADTTVDVKGDLTATGDIYANGGLMRSTGSGTYIELIGGSADSVLRFRTIAGDVARWELRDDGGMLEINEGLNTNRRFSMVTGGAATFTSSIQGTNINATGTYRVDGTRVVKEQQVAIGNAGEGAPNSTRDHNARAKINVILAMLRAHGLIDT